MPEELRVIFDKYKNVDGSTIMVLQEIQNLYGYLPDDAMKSASQYFSRSLAEIYGVASFYTQFRFNKPGKYQVKVCHGTACHINNAVKMSDTVEDLLGIGDGETTDDELFSLEKVACLGCCSLAPVVMVNEKVYGNLDEKKLKKIMREYQRMDKE